MIVPTGRTPRPAPAPSHAKTDLEDTFQKASEAAPGLGQGIELAWSGLSQQVRQVSQMPVLNKLISVAQEQKVADVVTRGAQGLGLAAAAVSVGAGAVKLIEHGNASQKLEGCFDVATGGAIAATLVGCSAAALVMAPVAAVCGVVGGGMALLHGNEAGDAKAATQGALNGSRALAVACSRMGEVSRPLAIAGNLVGGLAAGIQMVRGAIELDRGVRTHQLSGEIDGLSDMGISAGLLLASTGVGIIPGVALMAVAGATPVLYSLSKAFHGWADKELQAHQGGLQGVVDRGEKLVHPLASGIRTGLDKLEH